MTSELAVLDAEAASSLISPEQPATGAWSDWVGMVASIGCAIHCAAMPFVIAYLPALGLSFLADEAFHKWMAVVCFLIALTAFVPGLRKHGRLTPVIVASVGLVMISVAAFGFAGECCPSCAAAATSDTSATHAALAEPGITEASLTSKDLAGSQSVLSSDSALTCTDESCPHCLAEGSAASEAISDDTTASVVTAQSSPWIGRIVPWLTPLGGIVLVAAHLLNRRYGCLCGCCASESSDGAIG